VSREFDIAPRPDVTIEILGPATPEDTMPFTSEKQRKWMHANEPELAKKWEEEAKRKGVSPVQPPRKQSGKKEPPKKGKR
jgi:hypothetical protein